MCNCRSVVSLSSQKKKTQSPSQIHICENSYLDFCYRAHTAYVKEPFEMVSIIMVCVHITTHVIIINTYSLLLVLLINSIVCLCVFHFIAEARSAEKKNNNEKRHIHSERVVIGRTGSSY